MIHTEFVNGLSGDPAVLVTIANEKQSFLFDIGSLDRLKARDLVRITHVFVSHAHIDHFIGFDRWLRAHIRQRRELFVVGPPGITKQVEAKLSGYTWNLLEDGDKVFCVVELLKGGGFKKSLLKNDNQFTPKEVAFSREDKALLSFGEGDLYGVLLDHGIPSAAYRYNLPPKCRIDGEKLKELGLKAGPWVAGLKEAFLEGSLAGFLEVSGRQVAKGFLAEKLCRREDGASVGYLTDIVFSEDNAKKARGFFSGCKVLVCEASFRHEDENKAFEKKHLTTKHAALIAAWSGVGELRVFHFSRIYGERVKESVKEASEFFLKFQKCGEEELAAKAARVFSLQQKSCR